MPNSDKQEVTAKMMRCNDRLHRRLFEKQVVKLFGIHRTQHIILMFLSRNENVSQKEIADFFQISPAAVAVTVKKLEKYGFIVKASNNEDNRKNVIKITSLGQQIVDETKKIAMDVDSIMLNNISNDELDFLNNILEKMHNNLIKVFEKEEGVML